MRKPRHIESLEYGPGKELRTTDPNLTEIFREVRSIYALADFPVVVQGETGTGKEGIARALHWHSQRRSKPFVAVNCGAIPEGIVDSEFFGHERGAFSGAITTRKGHFEVANGGTLFLDEISELPLTLQARLLRVLQESEIVRVGSSRVIKVDVRIVAATNKDLKTLVGKGKFRADLYYRISTATVHLQPLRERPADIMMLARTTRDECLAKIKRSPVLHFQPILARVLRSYPWPGNVRELKSTIEVAIARAVGGHRKTISIADLNDNCLHQENQQPENFQSSLERQISQYLVSEPDASIISIASFLHADYYKVRRIICKIKQIPK
ncbi:MAG: sigma 54-interacting transcriptional regulator [Myxococcales bacterium]|nr:sigma 54-interacting transcriptional regulator [Myxococcales bacterium]